MVYLARITLLSLLITLFGCCQGLTFKEKAGPVVTGVTNLPDFITNSKGQGRDAGRSAKLGNGKLLWVFDDTFTPSGLRSATGAWADTNKPNVITEEVDSKGSPYQFYPFTATELAYNNQQENNANPCCQERNNCTDSKNPYCHCPANTDCHQRYAMWSERPYALNSSTILLIYRMQKIGYAGNFDNVGMGIAYSNYPTTIATRVMTSPDQAFYIFDATDTEWDSFVLGNDGYIYFTSGSLSYCVQTTHMARVPIDKIAVKSAYSYWDGSSFVSNSNQAKPIGEFGALLGSCMWSTHLKAYLAFALNYCTGPKAYFRTAPNPWGPWSNITAVDFSKNGAVVGSYAGELHPELSSGNSVFVSYFVPHPNFSGLIVTRQVTFQ